MFFTYGIPPEFHGGVHIIILNGHTPLGQSQIYRVTQLRTDAVDCRASASKGPVNPKVVPNEWCLGRSSLTNKHAPLFSHTHYWYEVGMLKVTANRLATDQMTVLFLTEERKNTRFMATRRETKGDALPGRAQS